MNPLRAFLSAALAAVVCLSANAKVQGYSALLVQTPDRVYPTGLNNQGQITGYLDQRFEFGPARPFITGANAIGIKTLDTPVGLTAYALALNDLGQVVGRYYNGSESTWYGFVTGPDGSGRTELGAWVDPVGINASGHITGTRSSPDATGGTDTFIRSPEGVVTVITGVRPGHFLRPDSINDAGQVLGHEHLADAPYTATPFITGPNGSDLRLLQWEGHPDAAMFAKGLNNSGQVTGLIADGDWPSFVTGPDGTGLTTLDPWKGLMETTDINDAGQLVGAYWTSGPQYPTTRAFVAGPGGKDPVDLNTVTMLPNDHIILKDALAINERGQILAVDDDNHAFLLTPVPEADAVAMVIGGLAVAGLLAGRRRAGGQPFATVSPVTAPLTPA